MPIHKVVTIDVKTQIVYGFSAKNAYKEAEETTKEGVDREIKRIEYCINNNQVLTSANKDNGMLAPGAFCDSYIYGFETECPFCSNLEPWQATNNSSTKNDLYNIINTYHPAVFQDDNSANRWKDYCTFAIIANIHKNREDAKIIDQAKKYVYDSIKEIQILNDQLKTIPEKEEIETLSKKLREQEYINSNIGIFDIKRKNKIKSEIKVTKEKLSDLNIALKAKSSEISNHITDIKVSLLKKQAIAYGAKDSFDVKRKYNSYAYLLKPNDIPDEITNSIKNETNEKASNTQNNNTDTTHTQMKSSDIIYCRKCGFKLLPESTFCTKCGAKID